ncbi:MAG: UDP-N-acetylmuramoyl-L-alanyl-D-glutamate--2,6-diaminopimelate ligase, partial [Elusimicrobiales bacterium]|nr:UDP-N-acetylmuramoyl-L-alanyl-D-glutamate--2,6-diaminopimelate ligase [Elusimicrobiales bacterium]
MKLSGILKDKGIKIPHDCEITQVENDSRLIQPGALFFALKGAHADGSKFIRQAIEKGAAAVFCEGEVPPEYAENAPDRPFVIRVPDIYRVLSSSAAAFYGNPSEKMPVIGITGTKGKTTSSCILENILSSCGMKPGLIGTLAYKADGEIISHSVNTTPFAHTLQQMFRKMLDKGCKSAVMEVSSHALALQRAEDVSFDIAVFTNLQRDHLDFHKDIRHYFLAKTHLFELLASNGKGPKAAVINADEPCFKELAEIICGLGLPLFKYGINSADCDFRAEDIVLEEKFSSFNLHCGETSRPVKISLPGLYNVYNTLAAISAAIVSGVSPGLAIKGAEAVRNVPGRLQRVEKGQDFNVFVDYAHTDAALQNVLASLGNMPHRRVITVFGCGGDRDRTKRGPMGQAACTGSDHVIITDDNPRYEDRAQIFADIEAGIKGKFNNYEIIQDRAAAIRAAISKAEKG